jgi:hypothetical protein
MGRPMMPNPKKQTRICILRRLRALIRNERVIAVKQRVLRSFKIVL